MKSEKAYTLKEIEDLRRLCNNKYCFGWYVIPENLPKDGYWGRSYQEKDKIFAVEEMVRTFMIAGLTAEDVRKQI